MPRGGAGGPRAGRCLGGNDRGGAAGDQATGGLWRESPLNTTKDAHQQTGGTDRLYSLHRVVVIDIALVRRIAEDGVDASKTGPAIFPPALRWETAIRCAARTGW